MKYTIIPVNEPHGEGNGWHECPEKKATFFQIDDGSEVICGFPTRTECDDWIKTRKLIGTINKSLLSSPRPY